MIDCHLHLQDLRLAPELASILRTLREVGVRRLVVNGTHPDDWEAVAALTAEHPEVSASFGLHPWRVGDEGKGWLDELESRLRRDPESGLGEIGLDRWIQNRDFGKQREVFVAQLELAERLNRPLSIHCLQAWGSLLEILDRAHLPRGFLLHSYGGPAEMVDEFAARGAYFSLSGYFFRPGKEKKLATFFDAVPEDRLLLESDAPDMAPPPALVRHALSDPGLNHPANLVALYEAVAARRGISVAALREQIEGRFRAWWGDGAAAQTDTARSKACERPSMP